MDIKKLLQLVVDRGASDLHLVAESPPVLRVDGKLNPLDMPALTPDDTQRLMEQITPQRHQEAIKDMGSADFGYDFGTESRFRVCVYRSMGSVGMALRLLPSRIMTLEELGLPPQVREILFRPKGLVLVTGPTGAGKTTTLAAFIDIINRERDCHIITIEDPIEYVHPHKQSIVTQQEFGVDTPSFAEALIRALRQDPDVILVGEMRDLATMEAAITAAETGHLVFATLHTTSAAQTIDRAVDVFPPHQQEQIRVQLSLSLTAVFCQQLIPRADGVGRVTVYEIMIATPAIQNLIRENKSYRIPSSIQTGTKYGMKMMDQSLFELYQKGVISHQEAVFRATDPGGLRQKISEAR